MLRGHCSTVLYEMVTGKRPYQGQAPESEQLPDKLAHVIERCLAQEPDDRWQSKLGDVALDNRDIPADG